ncbi:helix-turn-helix domain-containing protein [Spelaeicoccus albus]
MPDGRAADGVPLSRLVDALGERLIHRRFTVDSDPFVTSVAIAEPGDRLERADGVLVLLVGVRGRDAAPAITALADAGPAAIAVKGTPGELARLDVAAADSRTALLGVHPDLPWHRLEALAADLVGAAPASDAPSIDLFTLAETVARICGGPVSIEDAGSAVLAYSSSGDEVDDLRRLSILGRQGPRAYLDRLAALGVYDSLRSGQAIVHVAEHPELGIKARTAVGVRHSGTYLGTVWVQGTPAPGSEPAMLGAVRLIGALMAAGWTGRAASSLVYDDALADALDGGDVDLARIAGVPPASRLLIGVIEAVPDGVEWGSAGLVRSAAINELAVRAASSRKTVMLTERDGQIVIGLVKAGDGDTEWMAGAVRAVAAHLRRAFAARVVAGIGGIRPVGEVLQSYALAVSALALPDDGDPVRDSLARSSEILLARLLGRLRADPEFTHPGIDELVRADPDAAESVLDFLRMGGFAAAAEHRGVHVNTVRHRVRRAAAITGLDVTGDDKLIVELLLRAALARRDEDA